MSESKKVPSRADKRKWGLRKTNKAGYRKRAKLNVAIPKDLQPWHKQDGETNGG